VLVPPLLLQPLIENALLHGEPGRDGVRRVRLGASRQDGRLRIEVGSTGPLAADATEREGLGLTRTRLRQAYGSEARISIDDTDGWVVARIEIDQPAEAEAKRSRA
jgi:LytS/YehU family sensor histidine kinase